jgi:hypothetical protein
MRVRHGTTLMEVLVSIFVMAIGLIALLALFPVGAFEMADALRDSRISACIANATSIASAWNLRHESNVTQAFSLPGSVANFVDVSQPPWIMGPSYPVYVDPMGATTYALNSYSRNWVAALAPMTSYTGQGRAGIRRVTTSFATTSSVAANAVFAPVQWCCLLDDITFDKNGTPDMSTGSVQHTYEYSWAYLLRRPKNSVPSVVEMWVVVYQHRPLLLHGNSALLNQGGDETFYSAVVRTPKLVTLTWPNLKSPPAVRPGSWILDCSATPNPTDNRSQPGNARFYQVVGVTENLGSTDVEVDSPIMGPPPSTPTPVLWNVGDVSLAPPNRFAVLDGVVQVVYKGTNWLP